jgi:hypothetical protein
VIEAALDVMVHPGEGRSAWKKQNHFDEQQVHDNSKTSCTQQYLFLGHFIHKVI